MSTNHIKKLTTTQATTLLKSCGVGTDALPPSMLAAITAAMQKSFELGMSVDVMRTEYRKGN